MFDRIPASDVVEVLKDRLYVVRAKMRALPTIRTMRVFSVDQQLRYTPFYSDFGPFSLFCFVAFCRRLDQLLTRKKHLHKHIVLQTYGSTCAANAAALMAVYSVARLGFSAETAAALFHGRPGFSLPFCDASHARGEYTITVADCAAGWARAMAAGFINVDTFDADEYLALDDVETSDASWVVPGQILAFRGPFRERKVTRDTIHLVPADYVPTFRRLGVQAVLRLNRPEYDAEQFQGIPVMDLVYRDGSNPPPYILTAFMTCVGSPGDALPLTAEVPDPGPVPSSRIVALHCKAGLGRTGTLAAHWLMSRHNFTALEAIAWLRIARPGSVVGPQQPYLEEYFEAHHAAAHTGPLRPAPALTTLTLTRVCGPSPPSTMAPVGPNGGNFRMSQAEADSIISGGGGVGIGGIGGEIGGADFLSGRDRLSTVTPPPRPASSTELHAVLSARNGHQYSQTAYISDPVEDPMDPELAMLRRATQSPDVGNMARGRMLSNGSVGAGGRSPSRGAPPTGNRYRRPSSGRSPSPSSSVMSTGTSRLTRGWHSSTPSSSGMGGVRPPSSSRTTPSPRPGTSGSAGSAAGHSWRSSRPSVASLRSSSMDGGSGSVGGIRRRSGGGSGRTAGSEKSSSKVPPPPSSGRSASMSRNGAASPAGPAGSSVVGRRQPGGKQRPVSSGPGVPPPSVPGKRRVSLPTSGSIGGSNVPPPPPSHVSTGVPRRVGPPSHPPGRGPIPAPPGRSHSTARGPSRESMASESSVGEAPQGCHPRVRSRSRTSRSGSAGGISSPSSVRMRSHSRTGGAAPASGGGRGKLPGLNNRPVSGNAIPSFSPSSSSGAPGSTRPRSGRRSAYGDAF